MGCPPANTDIVSLLAELIHTLLPIAAKVKWIKAHQDHGVGKGKLTTSGTLNIMSDAMASNFLAKCPNTASRGPRKISPHYPTMQASLIIAKSRIHTGTAAKMRNKDIKSRRYWAYFIGKYDENREQQVNWDNQSAASREQAGQTQTTKTKCIYGWLSTGARRQVMHQGSDSCVHCGERETNEHMHTCKHPKSK